MPRDISLEKTLLELLDLLSPSPMREAVLAREAEIRLDRLLTTAEVETALKSLQDRGLLNRGKSKLDLPQAWITEAGRAALRD